MEPILRGRLPLPVDSMALSGQAGSRSPCPTSRSAQTAPPTCSSTSIRHPRVIRLVVMMGVRYPLSLRNDEDLPLARGHIPRDGAAMVEEVRSDVCAQNPQVQSALPMRPIVSDAGTPVRGASGSAARCNLWQAVDHEDEIPESFVTRTRDKAAALRFLKRAMKRYGYPEYVATGGQRSKDVALAEAGNAQDLRLFRAA